MLARGAMENSSNNLLSYNNLADFVQESENLAHIQGIFFNVFFGFVFFV